MMTASVNKTTVMGLFWALFTITTTNALVTPEGSSELCLVTQDQSGQVCHNLLTHEDDETPLGSVCVHMVPTADGGKELSVTIDARDPSQAKLTKTKFWMGNDISAIPRLSSGAPDLEAFPYYFCNSTGVSRWTVEATETEVTCTTGGLSMIAFVELETKDGKTVLHK